MRAATRMVHGGDMTQPPVTHFTHIDSPVGPLLAVEREGRLCGLEFTDDGRPTPDAEWVQDDAPFEEVRRQLGEYFGGIRRRFDLPLAIDGTEFQRLVWDALLEIPYGTTASYGEVAAAIGRPNAVRAVGGANNRNRLPIVIPCHRVIGADGSLTGFGGGMDRKVVLLGLEERNAGVS